MACLSVGDHGDLQFLFTFEQEDSAVIINSVISASNVLRASMFCGIGPWDRRALVSLRRRERNRSFLYPCEIAF